MTDQFSKKRLSTAIAEKGAVIGVISRKDFLELIHPFSQFATYLSRNIIYKDKVIDDLQDFKSFILASIDKGPLDMEKVIESYKKKFVVVYILNAQVKILI